MNDEIKEILDNIKEDINGKFEWEYIDGYYVEQIKPLLDYITNLQQDYDNEAEENLKLSEWLVEKQQRIEGLEAENETLRSDFNNQVEYTNKIAKENETRQQDINNLTYQLAKMKEENERLKAQLYGCDELLENDTRTIEDYKSRCEKADNQLKIIMQIIKEQPTRNIEDDEWLENRLIGVANILQNGSDEE